MKKVIFLLIPMILFISGCYNKKSESVSSEEFKKNSKNIEIKKKETTKKTVKEEITFYSDLDESFRLELPVGWTAYDDPEELMEGGNLSFHKGDSIYGTIAISESTDFDSFKEFSETSYEAFEISKSEDIQTTIFDNGHFKGHLYIINDSFSGLKMRYAIYILEGSNEFIEGQFWSQISRFDKNFEEGNSIFETLSKEK